MKIEKSSFMVGAPVEFTYDFKELFDKFISGTPIKRKPWGGYWKYSNGNVEMHCKNGKVINIKDTEDILFTLSNLIQGDWEVATNENCEIEVK